MPLLKKKRMISTTTSLRIGKVLLTSPEPKAGKSISLVVKKRWEYPVTEFSMNYLKPQFESHVMENSAVITQAAAYLVQQHRKAPGKCF